jgi:protein tyrosine phosphatase (PTP) superfamily phosphohydrolase (DUF442 family)
MTSVQLNNVPSDQPRVRSRGRRIFVGIAILAIVSLPGGYIAMHLGQWEDMVRPRKFRTVEPGSIYASGQINHRLIRQVLVDNHIQVIICLLADDPVDPDVLAEQQAAQDLGIVRYNYNLSGDGTGDIQQYADAIAELSQSVQAHQTVLLHCSSGAQRSNGATYFYRVLVEHWAPADAEAEMERNGFDPHSNPLLIPYLNAHMREMADLLVQKSVINQVPDPLPQISR